jgi:hypothetical protein
MAVVLLGVLRVSVRRARRLHSDQRYKTWVAWITNCPSGPKHEYDIQDCTSDPIAFSATSDPGTMFWHQAMQQPDKAQFLQAAVDEVKSHVDNKHFILVSQSSIPKNTKVFASVCSMKRKRQILSGEVYKWKV